MSGRIIVGLILLVLGVGFLLQELAGFDFGPVLGAYWPLIIVLIGVAQLLSGTSTILGALIVVGIGAVIQLAVLGMLSAGTAASLWPLILVAIGLTLLIPRLGRTLRGGKDKEESPTRVDHTVFFSDIDRRLRSDAFEGGELTVGFGEIDLDLREGALAPDGARIEANVFFGSVDIAVPPGWRVNISGTPLLGGWDNRAEEPGPDTPADRILRIKAFVLFGNLDVKQ